ncbi:50S ribosomal protein L11 methyltransferase [Ilyomonas limi]|uniref:Ribosomal protein L11 methyltransferase n=1 Tax=Ilyomonas limi TaxID=2575867 RepID=A0A4U3LD50_9BACT|nr:50S ribosomal protein L11 methyltransferase [Ilyomonas limi]TKK72006.1 50S ribosomal protein L11 methyltransferase [Ilyomonas limi]
MNTPNYIEVIFNDINAAQSNILIALLNNCGFEGFEEREEKLKAYISERDFDTAAFAEITSPYRLSYHIHIVPSQNWNAVWEEQFEPVSVHDFVGIRAHFHPPFAGKVAHEIVITPKMSFGTGHHATTWMMIEQMQQIDFANKQVLDFGTGTGILAIVSEKLGAAHIWAIDVDEWSIENAKENIARNNCGAISLQQADKVATGETYDVILANINKNIILQNIQRLNDCLATGGCLLISGLLAEDEPDILAEISSLQVTHKRTMHRQQWIAMLFTR